uniref:Putative secreted protein n=1 Tax=Panstrongylus lignarius TaxID=156445 RepID=A0A224XNR3_9HEMI
MMFLIVLYLIVVLLMMMCRMNKNLYLFLFVLSVIIQTNYGALLHEKVYVPPGEPQVCKYSGYTIAAGTTFNDRTKCAEYVCSKSGNANELLLEVVTCGVASMNVKKPCFVEFPRQGIPYPQCCSPKVVCPPGAKL